MVSYLMSHRILEEAILCRIAVRFQRSTRSLTSCFRCGDIAVQRRRESLGVSHVTAASIATPLALLDQPPRAKSHPFRLARA